MTGREAVAAALKKIGVLAAGDSMSAEDATDGLAELNRMLKSWKTETLMALDAYETTLTLDSELSYPDGYEDALIYGLAVRLAPDYGKAVSADLAMQAMESKNNVKRSNTRPARLEVDKALLPRRGFNINTGTSE